MGCLLSARLGRAVGRHPLSFYPHFQQKILQTVGRGDLALSEHVTYPELAYGWHLTRIFAERGPAYLHWLLCRPRFIGADKIEHEGCDSVDLQNRIALAFREMRHMGRRPEIPAGGYVFERRVIPFRSHSYGGHAADHRNVL